MKKKKKKNNRVSWLNFTNNENHSTNNSRPNKKRKRITNKIARIEPELCTKRQKPNPSPSAPSSSSTKIKKQKKLTTSSLPPSSFKKKNNSIPATDAPPSLKKKTDVSSLKKKQNISTSSFPHGASTFKNKQQHPITTAGTHHHSILKKTKISTPTHAALAASFSKKKQNSPPLRSSFKIKQIPKKIPSSSRLTKSSPRSPPGSTTTSFKKKKLSIPLKTAAVIKSSSIKCCACKDELIDYKIKNTNVNSQLKQYQEKLYDLLSQKKHLEEKCRILGNRFNFNINRDVLVFIDFDNTLYPTSYVVKMKKQLTKIQKKQLDDKIYALLIKIIRLIGKIYIVTSASSSWIFQCCQHLPKTFNLIRSNECELVSAREWRQIGEKDMNTKKWKCESFIHIAEQYFQTVLLKNKDKKIKLTRDIHLISIGDGREEHEALEFLTSCFRKSPFVHSKSIQIEKNCSPNDIITILNNLNNNVNRHITSRKSYTEKIGKSSS